MRASCDEHVDEVRRLRPLGEDPLDDERPLEPLHARHHRPEHLRHPAHADPIEQDVAPELLRSVSKVFHRPHAVHFHRRWNARIEQRFGIVQFSAGDVVRLTDRDANLQGVVGPPDLVAPTGF